MKSIFKISLILFLIPLVSFANNDKKYKQEKSRTIKKEYSVSSDATVKLDNKYGNLNITTWNKNRVEITVKITVKGNSQSTIEKKLRDIDVEFHANSDMVSAKTRIPRSSSSWSFWGKSNKLSYQINYTVKMPASNNVELNNDYGNIQLDELNGSADIDCDYGKIIIGELNNSNNSINMDYCKGSTINFMKSGSVNADYSKLTIDKTDKVKINSDYSNITVESSNKVTFNADYGSITVNDVRDITGNTDYVSVRLGTVSKNLNIDADYGSIKIKELARGFERVEISGEYAGITIGVKPNTNFDFMIDLQYASFRYGDANVDMRKRIVKSSKKYYEGSYGKGSSNSKVIIKSQYGGVRIKE
jgi:phage gp45-like